MQEETEAGGVGIAENMIVETSPESTGKLKQQIKDKNYGNKSRTYNSHA